MTDDNRAIVEGILLNEYWRKVLFSLCYYLQIIWHWLWNLVFWFLCKFFVCEKRCEKRIYDEFEQKISSSKN